MVQMVAKFVYTEQYTEQKTFHKNFMFNSYLLLHITKNYHMTYIQAIIDLFIGQYTTHAARAMQYGMALLREYCPLMAHRQMYAKTCHVQYRVRPTSTFGCKCFAGIDAMSAKLLCRLCSLQTAGTTISFLPTLYSRCELRKK